MSKINSAYVSIVYPSFIVFFIGGIFADFITNYSEYMNKDFTKYSLIFRMIFNIEFLLILIFGVKKIPRNNFFLLLLFVISMIFLFARYSLDGHAIFAEYLDTAIYTYKALFVFIIYICLVKLFRVLRTNKKEFFFNLIDKIFLIYIIFIFIGFFTKNNLYSSYQDNIYLSNSMRPGYKGILPAVNDATYFIMLSIEWFWLRWVYNKKNLLLILLSLVSAFILGAKGAMLLSFMLLTFNIFIFRKQDFLNILVIFFVIIVIISYSFFYTEILTFYENFTAFVDYSLENDAISHNGSFLDLFSFLVSSRDMLTYDAILLIVKNMNENFFYWFFSGYPFNFRAAEIDIVDSILYSGVFFTVALVINYYYVFSYNAALINKLIPFITAWVVLVMFGGHVFSSSVCSPFFAIIFVYLNDVLKNEKNN
jgi:hypothetical protein